MYLFNNAKINDIRPILIEQKHIVLSDINKNHHRKRQTVPFHQNIVISLQDQIQKL